VKRCALLACLLWCGFARADGPVVLRMAGIAPEGTAWAREVRAFSREVESATHGQLKVKWYLGGIAGDDTQMADRMAREQLDGAASGGPLCLRAAPSLQVMRIPGLVQAREEAHYLLSKLAPTLFDEAHAHGYALLGFGSLGLDVMFLRKPVSSWEELRKVKLWRWDIDAAAAAYSRAMGLDVLTSPLLDAAPAFVSGRVDGLVAIPSAALAFQWYEHVHHLLPLPMGALPGCLIMRVQVYEQLTLEQQAALRAAGAKLGARFGLLTQEQDDALLGGLFAKQGLVPGAVPPQLKNEYFEAGRVARAQLGDKLVPTSLQQRAASWLADWRAEHGTR
jgi:TRAP-type C4-dicarboxylate transport system substrate-binding protein